MRARLLVSREARADIAEAVEWLRERSPDLPSRFLASLESVYAAIVEHPRMYEVVYKQFRRALTPRFPYSVIYIVDHQDIVIMGVVQSRHPRIWQRRL